MLHSSLNPILLLLVLILLLIADKLNEAQDDFGHLISEPYAKLSMLASSADRGMKAYSLTSVMRVLRKRDRFRIDLQEWHSLEQRRSKVKYRRISALDAPAWWRDAKLPDEGTVHTDNQGRLLIVAPGISCLKLTSSVASMMFELQALKNTKTQDIQPYLIGPARLLQVLALNLHNVKQIGVGEDGKAQPAFPSLRQTETKLQFKLELGDNLRLLAFYSGRPDENLDLGVPLQLHLRKSNDFVLVYQFERVEKYPAGSLSSHPNEVLQQYGPHGQAVKLDEYALEPAIGCARQLSDPNDLTGLDADLNVFRFSFAARPEWGRASVEPYQLTVAHEPSLATLRVNRADRSREMHETTNFKLGRRYHVLRRRLQEVGRDALFDRLLSVRRDASPPEGPTGPDDENLSCFVSRTSGDNRANLGQLLLGKGQFSYLGRAKVRGLRALVFEAHDSEWPHWVQPPVVFYKSASLAKILNDRTYTRPTPGMSSAAPDEPILNTVIYLSDFSHVAAAAEADSSKLDITRSQLLLIEVLILDRLSLEVLEKVTFPIYDFSWDLSPHKIELSRTEDFFAMGDECPSSKNYHYGRIDLLLGSSVADAHNSTDRLDWLQNRAARNLALAGACNSQLGIPSTMIYELDSKLEITRGLGAGAQVSIAVSFRLLERSQAINQLAYLGRARFKPTVYDILERRFMSQAITTFYSCYLLAAHTKLRTVFAYEPLEARCYIFKGQVVGQVHSTVSSNFEMAQSGEGDKESASRGGRYTLELYRVLPEEMGSPTGEGGAESEAAADKLTALARGGLLLKTTSALDLVSPLKRTTTIKFKVYSFKVHELEEKSALKVDAPLKSSSSNQPLVPADTNKFPGFGLVPDDRWNTRAEPDHIAQAALADFQDAAYLGSHVGQKLEAGSMSFGECRWQCLLDLECRSYSFCLRPDNDQAECVVSRVNFRSHEMALQLATLVAQKAPTTEGNKYKFGQTYDLTVPGKSSSSGMRVKRHPLCELHNKNHLELFHQRPTQVQLNLANYKLSPVGRVESCARLCVRRTVKALEEEAKASPDQDPFTSGDEKTLENSLENHKRLREQICTHFAYINKATFEGQIVSGTTIVKEEEDDEATDGYCLLMGSGSGKEQQEEQANRTAGLNQMKLDQFAFDFRFLYDDLHGLSLTQSPMSQQEQEAYKHMSAPTEPMPGPDQQDLRLMSVFVERGDNSVVYRYSSDLEQCARLCFLQLVPVWPACRSFDYVEKPMDLLNLNLFMCRFNSITMRQAIMSGRRDLVVDHTLNKSTNNLKDNATDQSQIWHYEPKPSFILDSFRWTGRLAKGAGGQVTSIRHAKSWAMTRVSAFALFWIVLISLALGLAGGLHYGPLLLPQQLMSWADRDVGLLLESDELQDQERQNNSQAAPKSAVQMEFRNLAAVDGQQPH